MGLPDQTELSPHVLGFVDEHLSPYLSFSSFRYDCSMMMTMTASRVGKVAEGLRRECDRLDAHLSQLHQSLSKLITSWISRSIAAQTALHNLNLTTLPFAGTSSRFDSWRNQSMLNVDLQRLVEELKQIENIRSYLNTALKLEAMVGDLEDAVFHVTSQPTGNDHEKVHDNFFEAVRFVNEIEDLLVNLNFESRWSHLKKSVDSRVDKALVQLRPQVLSGHRALLSSIGWPPKVLTSKIENGNISALPNPLLLMQENKQKAYSQSSLALCALQHLQVRREERRLGGLLGFEKIWVIDELVYPIASRVECHLLRWTDQPEFIFALVYKITKDFVVGVDDILQPIIDRAKLVGFSAKEAWISAMVQMLSAFLAKQVFTTLTERFNEREARTEIISSWLHLVDLMVKFDKQILSLVCSESYLRTEGLSLFSLFSDRPDWLKFWSKAELKYSKMKLKEESKRDDAWLVGMNQEVGLCVDGTMENFVLYSREDYNAPVIVESALKLAWGMIERSKTLPGIFTRIKFIRLTSAKVIWYLLNLLLSRGEGIKLSAVNSDDDSLKTLCGSINAAKYCEFKLQDWSNDIYFIEMDVAEKDKNVEDDGNENGFFGEEIKALTDMEMNWLMEIIACLLHQFEILTLDYVRNKLHLEQEEEQEDLLRSSTAMGISVSVDFVKALDALRSRLHLTKASLNSKDFSDLWRNVAHGIDRFIFRSIFMNYNQFSGKGTKQIEADMLALLLIFKPFCARPEAFFPSIRVTLRL